MLREPDEPEDTNHLDEPGWFDKDEASWADEQMQNHLDSFSEEP